MIRLAVVVMMALAVPAAWAQDSVLSGAGVIATFKDARSVGVDPAGRIYVADAGEHVIRIMDQSGSSVYVLGGPGTHQSEFDEPHGVDPTNGLAIVVADAGNGRLQRFTRAYQLIESIPLYGQGPNPVGSGASLGSVTDNERPAPEGRPISVTVSETNEIYAVDELRGAVATWDGNRRFQGFIGASNDFGRLEEPVDVAVHEDVILVADRKRGSILVYDQFGGFVTEYGGGTLVALSGITSRGHFIIASYGTQVAFFDHVGVLISRYDTGVSTHIRDVAAGDTNLLVLTEKQLHSFKLPESARSDESSGVTSTRRP